MTQTPNPGLDADSARAPADHLVQFYENDDLLAARVVKFLGEGLPAGDLLTVIATDAHKRAFERRLEADGFDVVRACDSGQLTFLDADETLSQLMRNGQPDWELFESVVGGFIAKQAASARGVRLRAYGEMVDLLWKQGERKAALRLEEMWNELQSRHSFTLFCAYAMASFYKEPAALHSVCGAHSHIVGDEDLSQESALPPHYARRLAREIVQREEVERALRESLHELRQKEEALRQSEEQLRDFVENATLGLHRVGPDGTILWANRAELDLLGYSADEYIGRPIAEFHVDQDVVSDMLERLSRGETLHNYEARLRAKDGSIKYALISSNVYAPQGKFVHTRCFTRDITERRRAEQALERSQSQLQAVTDALPVLIAYVDSDGRYQFVSAAYERWFGKSKADVIGKHVEQVLGSAAYEAVRPHVARALAGETCTYEAELPYRDGGTRFVEATYIPQFGPAGSVDGYVALVIDITERKSFERFRATAAARAERLLKITAAVADAVTAGEVLEAIVDHVASAVDASSAGLWLLDDERRNVTLARSTGYSEAAQRRFQAVPLDASPSFPALDAIRRGEPVWIPSQETLIREYPHLSGAVTPGRSYRISCLPVVSGGRTVGALGLTIERAGDAGEEERNFLLLVARYAGQAIERLRLLEAERKSRMAADAAASRVQLLSRVSQAFVETSLNPSERTYGIVRELGRALNGSVGIALLQTDGRLHVAAVHHPIPEAERELQALTAAAPLSAGEGLPRLVASTGKSVLIGTLDPAEMAARARPAYREFLQRYPAYALICAPLTARGRVIGIVTAMRTQPGETYAREDLELLEELAERAASAIENSRLHRENVEARFRAEQTYRFAQAVVSAEKLADVFEAALDVIASALGTNRSAILLYDADDVMRFKAVRNLSEEYQRAVEGHSPWPRDALAPEPVLVPDVRSEPTLAAYGSLFEKEGISSLAFIPLVSRGQLIGKFMVYYAEPHVYSSNEIELAAAIANHLASVTVRFAVVSKLEETIRYNELFAGVLAHDLRNPLGAMMNAAQLLLMRQEGEGDRTVKPLSRILSSGQRMTRMIDQLLDFTRARVGGGIEIQPREANLADLCAQAIGELELAYPDRKIHYEVSGEQWGSWDPDRLLQVVSNLVANAGQHGSPDSAIVVRLEGTSPDLVTLQVHNKGAIPHALLPTLFDPFRGTHHERAHARGLGLGLFIVREIARAHGGTVIVTSSEAEGTTFTLRLPRRTPRGIATRPGAGF